MDQITHFSHSYLGYYDVDSDKFPFLISGYLREAEHALIIPNDIKKKEVIIFIKYKIMQWVAIFNAIWFRTESIW